MKKSNLITISNPWNGLLVGHVTSASPEQINQVVQRGRLAAGRFRESTPFDRRQLLFAIAQAIEDNAEIFSQIICVEVGKTIKEARREVARAQNTLRLSAEAAGQLDGEVLHCTVAEHGTPRWATVTYQPVGLVAAITPFNYPLNLLCHKLGPAIAAGNAIVIKPSPKSPMAAAHLVDLVKNILPVVDLIQIVHGGAETAIALAQSQIDLLSFTGGTQAGLAIRRATGMIRCLMELGGNDPLLVLPDADLDKAAQTAVAQRFEIAGQSCAAVKKLYVHETVHDALVERVMSLTQTIRLGDPLDPETEMGPVIDGAAGLDVYQRISEAVQSGAKQLAGSAQLSKSHSNRILPTVLDQVSPEVRLWKTETFGPVIAIRNFIDIDSAIDEINMSGFGLQAGIFSNDHNLLRHISQKLVVGGVMINEGPDFRVEQVPFGGVKSSGLGREGVRITIREMSETKVVIDQ